jgi:hypothetical protein
MSLRDEVRARMGKKGSTGEVTSFGALHNRLSSYREGWIFRGHADASWKLVPKAGRKPYSGHEAALFERWKRRAVEHMTSRAATDWDLLAIAQHHGLATRLLDWTTNPLNAAFFSVQESRPGPAIIHAARFGPLVKDSADEGSNPKPLSHNGVAIFRPRGVVPRIVRQDGLFTVHGPPETALDSSDPKMVTLHRIEIAESYRAKLLEELACYGVHAASLFADLDGLSRYLNWTVESGGFLD